MLRTDLDPSTQAVMTDPQGLSQRALLEAALFQHREPLTPARLALIVGETPKVVESLLAELARNYDEVVSGLTLRRVADGYVLLAKPACLARLEKFLKPRSPISPAALETLALIAYGQPVTATEVMQTRGVHTPGVLETLLARKLIRAAGRRKGRGNPILYRTTREFLLEFGLEDLDHLPPPDQFRLKD